MELTYKETQMKLIKIQELAKRLRYDKTPVTKIEIGEAALALYELLDLLNKIELCNIFKGDNDG